MEGSTWRWLYSQESADLPDTFRHTWIQTGEGAFIKGARGVRLAFGRPAGSEVEITSCGAQINVSRDVVGRRLHVASYLYNGITLMKCARLPLI